MSPSTADDVPLESADSPLFTLSPESLRYAVNHVFLPVDPDFSGDYLKNCGSLIRAVCAAARAYATHVGETEQAQWKYIIKMLDNLQAIVQPRESSTEHIISQLRGMETGDILAYFIRQRMLGVAMIVTKREHCTLFEAFEVPTGPYGEWDFVRSYPELGVETSNVMFDDEEFQAKLAAFLSGGSRFIGADHPHYMDELLNNISRHVPYAAAIPCLRQRIGVVPSILRSIGRVVDVSRITKRVRNVEGRRSPIWLLIKVSIQMALDRSLSRSSYKSFLLFFMCALARDERNTSLSRYLLHLMSATILRRLNKLGSSTPVWLSEMALDTHTSLREILDTRWQQLHIRHFLFQNPTRDELLRDMRLSPMKSHEYIRKALDDQALEVIRTSFRPNYHRRGTIHDFLSSNGTFFDEAYTTEPNITLYDFERSVEEGIDDWVASVTDVDDACALLALLTEKYMSKDYKTTDPERASVRLLTLIELCVALDKLVIKEVPMLADYPPLISVDAEPLLLRKRTSLHRLSCVLQYLSARKSQSRSELSVLSDEFAEDSFPVRYYDQSPDLQKLKAHIEAVATKNITSSSTGTRMEHSSSCLALSQFLPCRRPAQRAEVSKSLLSVSPMHSKVVMFELRCPPCVRIWRSIVPSVSHVVNNNGGHARSLHRQDVLVLEDPELQPYLPENILRVPFQVDLATYYYNDESRSHPQLRYVHRQPLNKMKSLALEYDFKSHCRSCQVFTRWSRTSNTSNDILAALHVCPEDFSLEEFVTLAHLRSSGAVQWFNILRGLRNRTLNLRRHQVYLVLSLAVLQAGPFDPDTGTWTYHQELQDPVFCNAILQELENLFMDVGTGTMDSVLMNSISLLLTRVLGSSPGEGVSDRAIALLRKIRRKTFKWVQELSYDLGMAPMSKDRRNFLLEMAATCRSTFDIDSAALPTLLRQLQNADQITLCTLLHAPEDADHVALRELPTREDIDALLSCAFFIHALCPGAISDNYLNMLLVRDRCLSLTIEAIMRDIILADPTEYGVDLAVSRVLVDYQSGTCRWEKLQYPNDRWLRCESEETLDLPSQTIHANLLNGELRVADRPLGSLPDEILDCPQFSPIFCNQGFLTTSSDIPGMDFMTLAMRSKCNVHFSLQDGTVILRVPDGETNNPLVLIPSSQFRGDLPPTLIDGHVHWLNLTTKVIEIRPFHQLWEGSPEHWRIGCAPGDSEYRAYRGNETLVDIRSPTWATISKCFECLHVGPTDEPRNLVITTTSIDPASTLLLSITLPRYSLSFFVNEAGELESRDFNHMVYDEDQSAGALLGLQNILILRPTRTLVPGTLLPRRILVPSGKPNLHGDYLVRINDPNPPRDEESDDQDDGDSNQCPKPFPGGPLYHTYIVDTELGCLIGNGGLASTEFLARLHAMTSWHRQDPLTGKTGVQAAVDLLQSAGCWSIMKSGAFEGVDNQYPQITAAYEKIQSGYAGDRVEFQAKRRQRTSLMEKRAAYLFPAKATGPTSPENPTHNAGGHPTTSIPSVSMPSTSASVVSSLRYIFNSAGSPTQITLDYLMHNRQALLEPLSPPVLPKLPAVPESPAPPTLPSPPVLPALSDSLPARVTLPRKKCRTTATENMSSLDQVLSRLHTDHPFRQKYRARLDACAQDVRMESRVTYRLAGDHSIEVLQDHYTRCRFAYLYALKLLKKRLGPTMDPYDQAHIRFGQWPSITADVLLRYLASTSPIEIPPEWKKCLTSLAFLLLDLQRARRLLRLALEGLEDDFSKELETEGCEGWNHEEHPDWLLIQIQGNFLIRHSQAEVAREIMCPRPGENGFSQNTVMQVNMGEGKSSVIIPIAAAALANGKRLVRVIVPKALTTQMFDLLVARLGWLTNRPIYHLPFSRSLRLSDAGRLHKLMRQCMAERGILLLQPEHVVSLKLMSVEADLFRPVGAIPLRQSDSETDWPHLQKWMHLHARDILDESDEILHARFQLIYTIGSEKHMDGCPDRWTITQQVLQFVKKHIYSLSRQAPNFLQVECRSPGSFPHVRIVQDSDISRSLILGIAEDVIAGQIPSLSIFQNISPELRAAIRSFISDKDVLETRAKRVEEYAKDAKRSGLWNALLLLRGLLTSDILLFALWERRWRVDYGLVSKTQTQHAGNHSESETTTMLAVPYRAKDVPAPNTQFGHPDLTIILTCLSYYYTGLSEKQLKTCFEILLDQDDPSAEYALWTKQFKYDPHSKLVPDSLLQPTELNLNPSEQWDKVIFPFFSHNQAVIDFYLSRVVFPMEAKEYPYKLSGSSWDLAEKREELITGFSGTNDGQWLLPMSVTQCDLGCQKGTSAKVLAYLLRPENDSYMVVHKSDERWITHTFLQLVVTQQPEIRVLLDVGSQILDLSNRQVAKAWLDITHDAAGAVYFNENDELMVLTRHGITQPMSSSPLSQQLGRCIVYLDHAHTRGTDIKLPTGSRAAVTLGPKVTKDALVQGCMRMRRLGHGHSVMFFAPPVVDRNIRVAVSKTISSTAVNTIDILCWAIHETLADIQHRAPYWAQQGIHYRSRQEAWSRFSDGKLTRQQLSNAWLQPELTSLTNLYAPCDTREIPSTFSTRDEDIQGHCKDLGILSTPSAQMDEEQEREVHRERERERQVELPPRAGPAEHHLHPAVTMFVRTGIILPVYTPRDFRPVFATLRNFPTSRKADVWKSSILATADFSRTIEPGSTTGTTDQYVRPVQWILSRTTDRDRRKVLVLVSPYEVSRLLPDIRASKYVHLHLYAPRTSQRMKPSDDLKLYTVPPLPSDWTPPWDLIDQLNVFAGQLYLRDDESYQRMCRFLKVPMTESPNKSATKRKAISFPSSLKEMKFSFSRSLLPFVKELLTIRTRGQPFAHTHMGKILQGQILTQEDFEPVAPRSMTFP